VVIIADKLNHAIRAMYIEMNDMLVTTLAGTATVAAFADGAATSSSFNQPSDVHVVHLSISGNDITLCLIADGNNRRIRMLDLTGTAPLSVYTLAGTGAAGAADGRGSVASFNFPSALTALPVSNVVWVADMYNSVVRRLQLEMPAHGNGGNGIGIAGVECLVSTIRLFDSSRRLLQLLYPFGLALTPVGESQALYISDQLQRRLLRADISKVSSDFASNTQNVSALILSHNVHTCGVDEVDIAFPRGIASTSTGELIVAETDAARVRVVEHMVGARNWTASISTIAPFVSASTASADDISKFSMKAPVAALVLATSVGDILLVSDGGAHVVRPLFVGTERLADAVQTTEQAPLPTCHGGV